MICFFVLLYYKKGTFLVKLPSASANVLEYMVGGGVMKVQKHKFFNTFVPSRDGSQFLAEIIKVFGTFVHKRGG